MASFLIVAVHQNKIAMGTGNAVWDVAPGGHWVAYCFQERFLLEPHSDAKWHSNDKSCYHRESEAFMSLVLTFVSLLLLTLLSANIMHMCTKSILMIRFLLLLPRYSYTGNCKFIKPCLGTALPESCWSLLTELNCRRHLEPLVLNSWFGSSPKNTILVATGIGPLWLYHLFFHLNKNVTGLHSRWNFLK